MERLQVLDNTQTDTLIQIKSARIIEARRLVGTVDLNGGHRWLSAGGLR